MTQPGSQMDVLDEKGLRNGYYVASKVKHAEMWRDFRAFEREPIISTWIDEAGDGESASLQDLWRRCVFEASHAGALIVYRRPDEVLKGAWVELGAALSAGVPVFAVGIEDFTVANHAGVTHCASLVEARRLAKDAISKRASSKPSGDLVERLRAAADRARAIVEHDLHTGLDIDFARMAQYRLAEAASALEQSSVEVGWRDGGPRPTFDQVRARATEAVRDLNDWCHVNEAEWTGWGDGEVPACAEWWRVKSGQALKALEEVRERPLPPGEPT